MSDPAQSVATRRRVEDGDASRRSGTYKSDLEETRARTQEAQGRLGDNAVGHHVDEGRNHSGPQANTWTPSQRPGGRPGRPRFMALANFAQLLYLFTSRPPLSAMTGDDLRGTRCKGIWSARHSRPDDTFAPGGRASRKVGRVRPKSVVEYSSILRKVGRVRSNTA